MASRSDFKQLSLIRQREAEALLAAGQYVGAYYLIGYAVECALKACIAKQFLRHTDPDRKLIQGFYTHDLSQLLSLSELKDPLFADPLRLNNWTLIKDWSEQARYDITITEAQARDLYAACADRKIGILL